MKNSVNSKTFDEIFAQRGEQVQPENMVRGEVYLLDHPVAKQYLSIAKVSRKIDTISAEVDGQLFRNTRGYWHDGWTEIKEAFKATPDQVELLNSYRV